RHTGPAEGTVKEEPIDDYDVEAERKRLLKHKRTGKVLWQREPSSNDELPVPAPAAPAAGNELASSCAGPSTSAATTDAAAAPAARNMLALSLAVELPPALEADSMTALAARTALKTPTAAAATAAAAGLTPVKEAASTSAASRQEAVPIAAPARKVKLTAEEQAALDKEKAERAAYILAERPKRAAELEAAGPSKGHICVMCVIGGFESYEQLLLHRAEEHTGKTCPEIVCNRTFEHEVALFKCIRRHAEEFEEGRPSKRSIHDDAPVVEPSSPDRPTRKLFEAGLPCPCPISPCVPCGRPP
ncbi:hypothetical protein PENTCL1PPCAC_322, partial [Pristionchus entomophagus]